MKNLYSILIFLILAVGLSSCSINVKKPKTPCTTAKITIDIKADEKINPNQQGNPSPVVIKIYSIQSAAAFNQASFFELYNLSSDNSIEKNNNIYTTVMLPNSTKKITLTIQLPFKSIGAIAAFQNLNLTTWRATPTNFDKSLTLLITSQSIEFHKE